MYKIAYIAAFDFENSPAAYNRFLSLSKVLEENFNTTKVITTFPLNKNYENSYEKWKIRGVGKEKITNLFIISRLIYYIIKNNKKFDTFILYSGYATYMLPLLLLKPFFSYKLVFDSVEIYLPPPPIKALTSLFSWNHILGYNFLIRFFDGAICISSFLENKHKKQGLKTTVVPPIFLNTGAKFSSEKQNGSTTQNKILYYGNPGKKDSLINLIKVSLLNKPVRDLFEVTIIGIDQDQYEKYCQENGINEYPPNIKVKGKVGLDLVYRELVNTNFTFLQRPYNINTKAGFPSKLVEALYFQKPIILNLTSDMKYYEIEKCSILCKDDSVESLYNALMLVSNMTTDEISILKENCTYVYKKYFTPSANLEKVKLFIESINDNKK